MYNALQVYCIKDRRKSVIKFFNDMPCTLKVYF